jgi:hypothetical protein
MADDATDTTDAGADAAPPPPCAAEPLSPRVVLIHVAGFVTIAAVHGCLLLAIYLRQPDGNHDALTAALTAGVFLVYGQYANYLKSSAAYQKGRENAALLVKVDHKARVAARAAAAAKEVAAATRQDVQANTDLTKDNGEKLNGRLTELLDATAKAKEAEGVEKGRQEQQHQDAAAVGKQQDAIAAAAAAAAVVAAQQVAQQAAGPKPPGCDAPPGNEAKP